MIVLTTYTYFIYIMDVEATTEKKPTRNTLETMLVVGVLYPAVYDFTQFFKAGPRAYFSEITNYFDMLYIWSSITNTILQREMNSQSFPCKCVMTIIFLVQIHKTFFFMRIFDSVSYIVTMIYQVIGDLKVFMLFYFILIFIFS